MAERRYPLSWQMATGTRVISSHSPAPRWLTSSFGLTAVLTGALLLYSVSRADVAPLPAVVLLLGLFFLMGGLRSFFLRAYFALDADRRTWRQAEGAWPYVRRESGSFDDALGIQLARWDCEGRTRYAILWRWRDEARAAHHALCWDDDYDSAYCRWIQLGRELRLPLVEEVDGQLTTIDAETVAGRDRGAPDHPPARI